MQNKHVFLIEDSTKIIIYIVCWATDCLLYIYYIHRKHTS